MDLNKLENEWFEDFSSNLKRESTQKDYLCVLKKLKKFIKTDNLNLEDITTVNAEQFIDYIKEHNASSTAEKTYSYIHSFYSYLSEKNIIDMNPFSPIQRPKYSRKHNHDEIMSFSEINFFLKNVEENHDSKAQAIAFLFATTGCTLSEGSQLDWGNFIIGTDSVYCKMGIETKRVTRIHEKTFEVIDNYRQSLGYSKDIYNSTTPLFLNRNKKRCSYNSLSILISKLLKECGFETVTAKNLRHSFAAYCLYLGIDKDTIKEQLGWKSDLNLGYYKDAVNFVDDTIIDKLKKNTVINKFTDYEVFYFDKENKKQ